MNAYFLMIAILQLFPSVSVNNPLTTWLPLIFILSVSAVREAVDDYKRLKSDRIANSKTTRVLRSSGIVNVPSSDVRVGDIMYLEENEEIPCDIAVLHSSGRNGTCYIQTTNIDGETNLKLRQACTLTQSLFTEIGKDPIQVYKSLTNDPLSVTFGQPDCHVYRIDATISNEKKKAPLDSSNFLLQVCHLRNTKFIYGVAIFTGNETKFGQNKNVPQMKLTFSDMRINFFTIIVFSIQLLLVVLLSIPGIYNMRINTKWYIGTDMKIDSFGDFIRIPARFLLLNSSMIPISLKVTLEICKVIYMLFVNHDENFHASYLNGPKKARAARVVSPSVTALLLNNTSVSTECDTPVTIQAEGGVSPKGNSKRKKNQISTMDRIFKNGHPTSPPSSEVSHTSVDGSANRGEHSRSSSLSDWSSDHTSSSVSLSKDIKKKDEIGYLSGSMSQSQISDGIMRKHKQNQERVNVGFTPGTFALNSVYRDQTPPADSVHAICNSSCLLENLGQVKYVFSDKTGTLTQNEMVLRFCQIYGHEIIVKPFGSDVTVPRDKPEHRFFQEFLRCILLCNSIVLDNNEMKCDSPDELCLVEYCNCFGGSILKKEAEYVEISVLGVIEKWTIEKELNFSSDRKRMSVIARSLTHGHHMFYCKGADDSVLSHSVCTGSQFNVSLEENMSRIEHGLTTYSNTGLRTLVMAFKELSEGDFNSLMDRIHDAETSLKDRVAAKAAAYEFAEQKLIPVGISGIEDLLQPNVAETVSYIRSCGVSVWMITGDKPNTAVNIGRSAGIIPKTVETEDVVYLSGVNEREVASCVRKALSSVERNPTQHFAICVSGFVFAIIANSRENPNQESVKSTAEMIDMSQKDESDSSSSSTGVPEVVTQTSTHTFQESPRHTPLPDELKNSSGKAKISSPLIRDFLRLCMRMTGVICCRVTPKQKAEIVSLVKQATGEVTLAIGDGGNDVIMIQTSDVGIGIVGKEGQQAARASDYVISEFRHLKRLLCVHGVNSVSRSWTVANFSLYKSVAFCVLQTFFSMYSSYSGVTLFNSLEVTLYNVLLFVPIVGLCLKQIYSDNQLLTSPTIYQYYNYTSSPLKSRVLFSLKEFILWVVMAFIQGIVTEWMVMRVGGSSVYDFAANEVFFTNYAVMSITLLLLTPNVGWTMVVLVAFAYFSLALLCLIFGLSVSGSLVPFQSFSYSLFVTGARYWLTKLSVGFMSLCVLLAYSTFGNKFFNSLPIGTIKR